VSKLAGSLDANALLRLLLNDIPSQSVAVTKLLSHAQNRYAIADLAIVEVEYALRTHYGFNREQIEDTLGALLSHPSIHTNTRLIQQVFTLYTTHPKLSFTDCCLAAYAEMNDATPLWTFDRKLAKQSSGAAQLIEA
jgi:predicted nucleic-acid-binding protein